MLKRIITYINKQIKKLIVVFKKKIAKQNSIWYLFNIQQQKTSQTTCFILWCRRPDSDRHEETFEGF